MIRAPIHWRFISLLIVVALLLMPTISAAAQEGGGGTTVYLPVLFKAPPAVEQIGPSGGTFPAVVVSPTDSAVLYVGTWGLGVQKSLDGGLTWAAMNNGLGNYYIQSLAILPDGNTLYAGTYGSGVYRSTDGGESWAAINSGTTATDNTLLARFIIYDIEIDLANSQTVFISGRTPGNCYTSDCKLYGYIYKSVNGGDQWGLVWDSWKYFTTNGDYSYDVDVDPQNSSIVYLSTHRNGIYKSANGGALDTWVAKRTSVTDLTARKIAIDPTTTTTLYNSTYQTAGVYKSTDGANTWTKTNTGLPASVYGFALTVNPAAPSTLYLGTGDVGVYKSTNGAAGWSSWGLSSNFIWDFQFDSTSPTKIYAATGGNGLQVSSAGAMDWQPAHEGIFNTNVSSLVILPGQTGTLYAAVLGGGVFSTSDQGETWETVNSGLTDLNVKWLFNQGNKLYALTTSSLFTLDSGASAWIKVTGPQVSASSPLEESGQVTEPEHDVPYSERQLIPEEEQFLLSAGQDGSDLIDPATATVTKAITAAAEISEGLYVGTNGAGLWLLKTTGWVGCGYNDAADPRAVYALFYNPYDGGLYASIDLKTDNNYLIISREECNNWNANSNNVQIPFSVRTINFAASSAYMFAATTNGVYYRPHQTTAWVQASGITGSVYDIAVDPTNANFVYAAASTGTYYSTNGGVSWSPTPRSELQGLTFVSVEVDRANPQIIYFGNKEGGTYQWNRNNG